MSAKSSDVSGVRVFEYAADGPGLRNLQDALAVIAEAMAHAANLVVIPADRLDPIFFELRTGFAGEMLQKFVNYRFRLAIIGDISGFVSESDAFRDFVYESNRGDAIWFLPTMDQVEKQLALRMTGLS